VATPIEVLVPDIGGFKDVSVIEVHVKDGQQIEKEAALVTLETEKAAMDVPAPQAGRITQVRIKVGDKVSEGSLILLLEPAGAEVAAAAPTADSKPAAAPAAANGAAATPPAAPATTAAPAPAQPASAPSPGSASAAAAAPGAPAAPVAPSAAPAPRALPAIEEAGFSKAYASPSVRKFAREVGADLGRITGTGPKGRITQEDVKGYVKRILTAPAPSAPAAAGSGLPKVAQVDFSLFGAVDIKPLSRIQKISGARLQASWINLPHVTQYDDADITDLEAVRGALKDKAAQEGVKLTPLVFIIKACIAALQKFPRFNASLDPTGENLVFKKYFHIGFAADTPNGLMVPVIRDADRSDIYQLARILGELSEKES